jgi:hypothetical protein
MAGWEGNTWCDAVRVDKLQGRGWGWTDCGLWMVNGGRMTGSAHMLDRQDRAFVLLDGKLVVGRGRGCFVVFVGWRCCQGNRLHHSFIGWSGLVRGERPPPGARRPALIAGSIFHLVLQPFSSKRPGEGTNVHPSLPTNLKHHTTHAHHILGSCCRHFGKRDNKLHRDDIARGRKLSRKIKHISRSTKLSEPPGLRCPPLASESGHVYTSTPSITSSSLFIVTVIVAFSFPLPLPLPSVPSFCPPSPSSASYSSSSFP